jgi:hypothetical protein
VIIAITVLIDQKMSGEDNLIAWSQRYENKNLLGRC